MKNVFERLSDLPKLSLCFKRGMSHVMQEHDDLHLFTVPWSSFMHSKKICTMYFTIIFYIFIFFKLLGNAHKKTFQTKILSVTSSVNHCHIPMSFVNCILIDCDWQMMSLTEFWFGRFFGGRFLVIWRKLTKKSMIKYMEHI